MSWAGSDGVRAPFKRGLNALFILQNLTRRSLQVPVAQRHHNGAKMPVHGGAKWDLMIFSV